MDTYIYILIIFYKRINTYSRYYAAVAAVAVALPTCCLLLQLLRLRCLLLQQLWLRCLLAAYCCSSCSCAAYASCVLFTNL